MRPEQPWAAQLEILASRQKTTERELLRALEAARARTEHLECAVENARTTGIAIGILVERHRITPDEAFAAIVRAGRASNRTVREVAQALVESGELLS
ncbi:ANTAR domain-containing protein [Pseudonocardia sp. RS11V-5]|uniref:ANTAR domain-containing protein n=1 Tax=Pseudonocardia terrae TaxID=2905831 RepID=UPI001E3C2EFC|nr:ANTAR domain-containing protein [Pseudonocardia terrae]MCE3551685.1 ANTAR domain-containing protein [Pseudonocardia terrae]